MWKRHGQSIQTGVVIGSHRAVCFGLVHASEKWQRIDGCSTHWSLSSDRFWIHDVQRKCFKQAKQHTRSDSTQNNPSKSRTSQGIVARCDAEWLRCANFVIRESGWFPSSLVQTFDIGNDLWVLFQVRCTLCNRRDGTRHYAVLIPSLPRNPTIVDGRSGH